MRPVNGHVSVESAQTRHAIGTFRAPSGGGPGVRSYVGGGWEFPTQGGGVA